MSRAVIRPTVLSVARQSARCLASTPMRAAGALGDKKDPKGVAEEMNPAKGGEGFFGVSGQGRLILHTC